ncbi:tonsoku-like protein, partial [Rhincodon typus]|uniref:tonsoku-like protein n=1 Tax=Rhincodon typus TaxID=259920 RepID=UPI00202ED7A3
MMRPSTSQPRVPYTPLLIPSFRVKVKVKKKRFVIGVPQSELDTCTIRWLAEEAARKYSIECGVRPRLSLTLDGALLSPHEPIINLLHDNEEVLAEVVSWDLPPLSERYKRACDSLAQTTYPSIFKILQLQEKGSSVDLSSLSLTKEHLTPILRALKLHTTTHQLCLSANPLGDDAMEELVACLVTMPNLTVLDLSSNQITHQGLRTLCETSRPNEDPAFQEQGSVSTETRARPRSPKCGFSLKDELVDHESSSDSDGTSSSEDNWLLSDIVSPLTEFLSLKEEIAGGTFSQADKEHLHGKRLQDKASEYRSWLLKEEARSRKKRKLLRRACEQEMRDKTKLIENLQDIINEQEALVKKLQLA